MKNEIKLTLEAYSGQITPEVIDPVLLARDLAQMSDGKHHIKAIKIFRAVTGLSLKQAKTAIDDAREWVRLHKISEWVDTSFPDYNARMKN